MTKRDELLIENKRLRVENDRLRDALVEIAHRQEDGYSSNPWELKGYPELIAIAREALEVRK